MIIIEMIFNLALLVALSVVSSFIGEKSHRRRVDALLQGVVFGGAAVVGMLHPLVLSAGLNFDGRSVVISLCGLFFGPVAVGVAGAMAAICRIVQAGMGMRMGLLVIASSALIGLAFHTRQSRSESEVSAGFLLKFGLLVHVVMLLLMFTIPGGKAISTLKRLGLPILLTYPLATVLIGKVLSDKKAQKRFLAALRVSEQKYRSLVEGTPDVIKSFDRQGRHLFVNPAVTPLTGREPAEFIGKTHAELGFPADHCRFWEERIRAVFETGEPLETEFDLESAGRRMIFNLRLIPVKAGDEVVSAFSISRDITEQRKLEQNYQMLFREMLDGFALHEIICDEQGRPADYRFLAANPAFERMTGLKTENLLGKTILEVLPKTEAHWIETYGKVALTGEPTAFESHIRSLERYFQVTAFSPAANQFACIFADITRRKQAEEELLREQGLYKDLVNTIPIGAYRLRVKPAAEWNVDQWQAQVESNFALEMVSDRFCEIVGIGRQELEASSNNVFDRIHPDDNPGFVRRNFDAARSLSFFSWEGRMVFPDQRMIWVHFESTPRMLENGELMWTGIVYDITERKRAEETLRVSEERFRSYFELPLIGNAMTSPEKGWLQVNDRICEILGYSREELMQMTWSQITHPDDLQANLQLFNRVKAGQIEGYTTEKRFIRKDGRTIHASISVRCLRNTKGEIDYFVVLLQDISERKQAEEEREKLQGQLLQAQKMQSVGRLAGGVAHDFNNMLGVILGHADMALEQIDRGTPLHEDLQEIMKAAKRSADLTGQLLAFARKQTINPKVMDLNTTVASMLKMLHRLIGENIELAWKPGGEIWPIKMDPSQVDQILANLAVNARDAIAGVGHLIIRTENMVLDDAFCRTHGGWIPGDYVLLSVSDTGAGMDKETLDHIFEPFFTTKDVGKGTGLGLAMVYGAVKQNHGFINVNSEPGQGTTFKIYLPRVEAAVEVPAELPARPAHGTETVLLAEDEEVILNLGTSILKKHGYTVLAARTPAEALVLAEQHEGPIHLLITDVVMPGMNGKELMNRLKIVRPDIKVLFMSGYTSDVIAHQGIIDDDIEFLQKPFSVNALAQKARDVLQQVRYS